MKTKTILLMIGVVITLLSGCSAMADEQQLLIIQQYINYTNITYGGGNASGMTIFYANDSGIIRNITNASTLNLTASDISLEAGQNILTTQLPNGTWQVNTTKNVSIDNIRLPEDGTIWLGGNATVNNKLYFRPSDSGYITLQRKYDNKNIAIQYLWNYTNDSELSSIKPVWLSGYLGSTYNYTIWTWNGSANTIRLDVAPTGIVTVHNNLMVDENITVSNIYASNICYANGTNSTGGNCSSGGSSGSAGVSLEAGQNINILDYGNGTMQVNTTENVITGSNPLYTTETGSYFCLWNGTDTINSSSDLFYNTSSQLLYFVTKSGQLVLGGSSSSASVGENSGKIGFRTTSSVGNAGTYITANRTNAIATGDTAIDFYTVDRGTTKITMILRNNDTTTLWGNMNINGNLTAQNVFANNLCYANGTNSTGGNCSTITLPSFPANYSWANITSKPTLFSTSWANITSKPTLFSTSWANITGKPQINDTPTTTMINTDGSLAITLTNTSGNLRYEVNATRRTIQTFPGNMMASANSVQDETFSYFNNGLMLTTASAKSVYSYDFINYRLSLTYGEFYNTWSSTPDNRFYKYGDIAVGVPITTEPKATKADVAVRFRLSYSSILGLCDIANSTFTWQNVTIGFHHTDSTPVFSIYSTFNVNASMSNWTTLHYYDVPLITSTGSPINYGQLQAKVFFLARQKPGNTAGVEYSSCLDIESITVVQYNG